MIAERGLDATRIADVAERAGTSPAAVLYWFGSKDELLAEALTFDEERFYADVTERLEELDAPRERLALLIERSLEGGGWPLWIELWSRAARDEHLAAARRRFDERWRGAIAAIVRDGIDAGDFAAVNVNACALVFSSLIDGLAVQLTLGDPSVDPDLATRTARAVADELLFDGVPSR